MIDAEMLNTLYRRYSPLPVSEPEKADRKNEPEIIKSLLPDGQKKMINRVTGKKLKEKLSLLHKIK